MVKFTVQNPQTRKLKNISMEAVFIGSGATPKQFPLSTKFQENLSRVLQVMGQVQVFVMHRQTKTILLTT